MILSPEDQKIFREAQARYMAEHPIPRDIAITDKDEEQQILDADEYARKELEEIKSKRHG